MADSSYYVPTVSNPANAADALWKQYSACSGSEYVPSVTDPVTAAGATWQQLSAVTDAEYIPGVSNASTAANAAWARKEQYAWTTYTNGHNPFSSSVASPPTGWGYDGLSTANLTPLTNEPTAPVTPPDVWRVTYPTSLTPGSGPCNVEFFPTAQQTKPRLALDHALMIDPDFRGATNNTNKICHFFVGAANRVFTQLYGSGTNTLTARVSLQGVVNVTGLSPANYDPLPPISTNPVWPRGEYHIFRLEIDKGTAGVNNGRVRGYMDGVLFVDQGGIQWAASGNNNVGLVRWNPTYGGTVPQTMYMYTDDMNIQWAP